MKSSPQHGSKSSSFLPDGGCPQVGVGEAKQRLRSEVEGPSSGGSGEPFRANVGTVEGTTASLPQSRDARVFLLTRWHCLHWGTRSEDPPNGAQAWASRLRRLSFVCVGAGGGGWGGRRARCRWPCHQLPILLLAEVPSRQGLIKGGRARGQHSTHKSANSQHSGDQP